MVKGVRVSRGGCRRRVPVGAWVVDGWDARRSGKRGIPVVGDVPPTPTGRQSEIGRWADNRIAELRRRAQQATREAEADLARLREVIRQKDEAIDELAVREREILGRAPVRLPVEAGLAETIVVSRRGVDNRREAAPLRAEIDQLEAERDELAVAAARIEQDITMVWREARSRARAVAEIARRREARYFRLLCHRHPDGPRLAELFDHPRVVPPAWVNGPADERSM